MSIPTPANPNQANPNWESLVNVLRLELQEYGGFMNLLKSQQEHIIKRNIDGLKEAENSINQQIEKSFKLRKRREEVLNVISQTWPSKATLGQYKKISITQNLENFPLKAQALLKALAEEINSLVGRTRHLLRQNQMLLARASMMTEQVLQAIDPKPLTKTYNKGGSIDYKTQRNINSLNRSA